MIISRIVGGLGNQMFQYAAGRSLATRHQVQLKLDLRDFEMYMLHAYALDKLSIVAKPATPAELSGHSLWKQRLLRRLPTGMLRSYYRERSFGYDHAWSRIGANAYIDGYFQSPRFFENIAPALKAEFVPGHDIGRRNHEILSDIRNSNSVALHVRRGDYVSNATTLSIHGVCTAAYYVDAVARVRERVEAPRFFVFSNDLAWARENLALGTSAVYVEGNAQAPEFDLHLMANCRHHVIANSTFSWWSAWLGSHPDQTVISPFPWFERHDMSSDDLIPSHWLKVPKVGRLDMTRADAPVGA